MDKEELVFNIFKDADIMGKKFRRDVSNQYKLTNEQINNIRAKISKYQIKKYGHTLDSESLWKTREEMNIINRRSNHRRRYYKLYRKEK